MENCTTKIKEYLTKKEIKKYDLKNKLNYIISPMGSGKTTAVKDLTVEYLEQDKKVLIITPYQVSKTEYTANPRFTEYLKKEQLEVKYLAKLVEEYVNDEIKLQIAVLDRKASNKERIDLFRKIIEVYFKSFDLVVYDEADFFYI
jgi:thymidine kinase